MVSRRMMLGMGATVMVAGCSASGPDQADALDQIAARIRAGFAVGEKTLANLAYTKGGELADGRYEVFVDYDLISAIPEIGLFGRQARSGERAHVSGERYVFVRSSAGWTLE